MNGMWVYREYEEQPVPIEQIDDIVYLRRNIEFTGEIWHAEEREVSLTMYQSEVFSHELTLSAQAESIVIAAEYAAAIIPKNTLMKSVALQTAVVDDTPGREPLTPACMESLAQSYVKLIKDGTRTADDVLLNPPELKVRVEFLLREPNEEVPNDD